MRADQREAGDLVLAPHLIARKEAAAVVTGGAGRSELTIVNVLMAGGAVGTRLLEIE
jgi:hypothetical protein